jgi:hypothetical protein
MAVLATWLAIFSEPALALGPSAKALCGYTPHNQVFLLDHDWRLWLPLPDTDPRRKVTFGPGLRTYLAKDDGCERIVIAAGTGTITWGAVSIQVGADTLTVNGEPVKFTNNVMIDQSGRVTPDERLRPPY